MRKNCFKFWPTLYYGWIGDFVPICRLNKHYIEMIKKIIIIKVLNGAETRLQNVPDLILYLCISLWHLNFLVIHFQFAGQINFTQKWKKKRKVLNGAETSLQNVPDLILLSLWHLNFLMIHSLQSSHRFFGRPKEGEKRLNHWTGLVIKSHWCLLVGSLMENLKVAVRGCWARRESD